MITSTALDRLILPLKGLGSLVATAPSPAESGTSLVVTVGDGAALPAPPFRAIVFASAAVADHEVLNVTAVSVDTLTIVRAQDGSSARSILVGDQLLVGIILPVTPSTGASAVAYASLTGKPTLGTASEKNIPPSGDASTTQVVYGTDTRLSDARTPVGHAASHKSAGSDALKLDELAGPTDVTTLNATTGVHGLLPKLGGGTTNFLRADGTWAAPGAAPSGFTNPWAW